MHKPHPHTSQLPDILLHDTGHIMLTDFDLSKEAIPRNDPSIVKSNSPNTVSGDQRSFAALLILESLPNFKHTFSLATGH